MDINIKNIEELLQTQLWGLSVETILLIIVPVFIFSIIFSYIRNNYDLICSNLRERNWKYRSKKGLIPYLNVLKERWSFIDVELRDINGLHTGKLSYYLVRVENHNNFLDRRLPQERIGSINDHIQNFEHLADVANQNITQGKKYITRIEEYQNYFDFAINQAEHGEPVDDFEPDLELLLSEIQDFIDNSMSSYNENFEYAMVGIVENNNIYQLNQNILR